MIREITFHYEHPDFLLEPNEQYHSWLLKCLDSLGINAHDIHYIFVTDEELLRINKTYLNHDYLTDIITFNNSDIPGVTESDIFISIDRVKENAKTFDVGMNEEVCRVMAHGLAHLAGYNDKTKEEQLEMRQTEERLIALFHVEQ